MEAQQAQDVATILALKAQASKIPGVTPDELYYFDHFAEKLSGVLKKRAGQ